MKIDHIQNKTPNKQGAAEDSQNQDDLLETGLMWTKVVAAHADVIPSGDHHEADEDSTGSKHAGHLDMGDPAKELETALDLQGDQGTGEQNPVEKSVKKTAHAVFF